MDLKKVILTTPITHGEQEIVEFSLRKPLGGDLRNVNLLDLLNMKVDALAIVLPRISTPSIHDVDVFKMDLADLSAVFAELFSFLPQNYQQQTASSTK